jgi:hypothetical protein
MRAPPRKQKLTAEEIALVEIGRQADAREDFLKFRHFVRPSSVCKCS